MYNFKEHFKVIIAYSARGTLNYAGVLPRIALKRFSGEWWNPLRFDASTRRFKRDSDTIFTPYTTSTSCQPQSEMEEGKDEVEQVEEGCGEERLGRRSLKKDFLFCEIFCALHCFPFYCCTSLSLSLISSLLSWHQQQKLFSSDWGFPLPDLFITGPRSLCKYPSSVSAFLFHSLCLSFSLSWSYSCTLNTFLVERSARWIERL